MPHKSRRTQYLVTVCVSVVFVGLGVISAWSTPVLPKFQKNETTFEATETQISWMLSMNPLGFMAGSLATPFIADRFGRRVVILGSALPVLIGTVISVCAKRAWLFCLTTFSWNIATGMVSTVSGIYMAEIVDTDVRGSLSICTKFMFNFGGLLMMCIGPFLSFTTLHYTMFVLPIMTLLTCWWIPESPYFYLKEGNVYDAKNALRKLRGYDNEKSLDDDLTSIQSNVESDMSRSSSFVELVTGKQYRKAIIISVGLKATSILTGGVTIQQYLAQIVTESKVALDLSWILIIFGAVRFLVGIMSSVLVDRVGRRPLLIWSYFGTGVCLVLVGFCFFLQEVIKVDEKTLDIFRIVPFVGIIVFNIISNLGFNSVLFVIISEVFPLNVKSIAMTSLNIVGGIIGFIIPLTYRKIKEESGLYLVFWIFGAMAFAGFIFSIFVVPETKSKNLAEIQMELQGGLVDGNGTAQKDTKDTKECTEMQVFIQRNDNSS